MLPTSPITSWTRHQRARQETAASLAEAERDEPHFECRKVQILQDSDGLFMGLVLTSNGIEPSENKVKAIVEAREPQSVSEIRSSLGLAT